MHAVNSQVFKKRRDATTMRAQFAGLVAELHAVLVDTGQVRKAMHGCGTVCFWTHVMPIVLAMH